MMIPSGKYKLYIPSSNFWIRVNAVGEPEETTSLKKATGFATREECEAYKNTHVFKNNAPVQVKIVLNADEDEQDAPGDISSKYTPEEVTENLYHASEIISHSIALHKNYTGKEEKCDEYVLDLLHLAELEEITDEAKVKAWDALTAIRKTRRKYKDARMMLEYISGFNFEKGAAEGERIVSGTRKYMPRRASVDLFEKSGRHDDKSDEKEMQ